MQKSISGILKKASEAGRPVDRVKVLQDNDCTPLRMFLMMALDKRVVWNLPDGVPPYTTPENEVDQEGTLINEMRRMYIFLKAPNPVFGDKENQNLSDQRRQLLFIQLLESVPADDAAAIVGAKERKLPWKGITVKVVNEAFPGLLEE